ncbi:sporulation YhaL family protein [Metabacillus herbersteinensis]|uniref:Sporulation YhaL family protein n=1 Tax=Metabacillus herbersteinensis TaxID=283816 RepID=A0ABV6GER2_9BACI
MILLPWWVYLCIIGIIYSGYMAFQTARQDRVVDEEFIENEGRIFIERIEKEREKRDKEKQLKVISVDENLDEDDTQKDKTAV